MIRGMEECFFCGRQISQGYDFCSEYCHGATKQDERASKDDKAVDNFAYAMKSKLRKKRIQGRDGWYNPEQCDIEDLWIMLREHIEKADMVDIANFAMMIWNREERPKDILNSSYILEKNRIAPENNTTN